MEEEVVEEEVAVIYLVQEQIIRPVDLVGALARRRATVLLVELLAVRRRTVHSQVAPRLHLDSLVFLRRVNLQKLRLDQVKRLVPSVLQAVLGHLPLVI